MGRLKLLFPSDPNQHDDEDMKRRRQRFPSSPLETARLQRLQRELTQNEGVKGILRASDIPDTPATSSTRAETLRESLKSEAYRDIEYRTGYNNRAFGVATPQRELGHRSKLAAIKNKEEQERRWRWKEEEIKRKRELREKQ